MIEQESVFTTCNKKRFEREPDNIFAWVGFSTSDCQSRWVAELQLACVAAKTPHKSSGLTANKKRPQQRNSPTGFCLPKKMWVHEVHSKRPANELRLPFEIFLNLRWLNISVTLVYIRDSSKLYVPTKWLCLCPLHSKLAATKVSSSWKAS